ncbi:hypothetical protein PYCCODRAFT_521108 [Trametes coccinea BRFM310]|uniref:NADH dehydrogenase [ubiquinone] 1 alpha subcomplex subunit n=1 Tax=Trametes coccinea (strain BRFM310) TaxID=1353009 RepID=A0A1Y2ILH4_TRAC3|nr:hypothetical protein PYCCODRAFT_521108 [Trametes coccinea BRFM310]
MSFLFRLFRRLRTPRGFVGRDLEGNQYFEYPGTNSDRTKRIVKYAAGKDMWEYVGGRKRLAIQWSAWLTHTRKHPPTIEELHADLERQRRVLFNAAMIEAREREEAARIAASQQQNTHHVQAPAAQDDLASAATAAQAPSHQAPLKLENLIPASGRASDVEAQSRTTEVPSEQPSPWKPPPRDEPHSWQPRVSVKRGG